MIRMVGSQSFDLILQVVSQVTEYPVVTAAIKFFYGIQLTGVTGRHNRNSAGRCQAVVQMRRQAVLVVVQKTANVEPAQPIQHLCFEI
jgi:hypothetical protein